MRTFLIVLVLVTLQNAAKASTQESYEANLISQGFIKSELAFVKPLNISNDLGDTKNEKECLSLVESYGFDEKNEVIFNDQCIDQAY